MGLVTPPDHALANAVLRYFDARDVDAAHDLLTSVAAMTRLDHVALDLDDETNELFTDWCRPAQLRATALNEPSLVERVGDDDLAPIGAPLVLYRDRFLYLRRLAGAEARVAAAVRAGAPAQAPLGGVDLGALEREAPRLVDELGLDDAATAAHIAHVATLLATRRVSLLTGGPGTGKTWTTAQAVRLLDRVLPDGARLRFATSAPTAKAERRATDGVLAAGGAALTRLRHDDEASGTLYHLLGVQPENVAHPRVPRVDVIVVDEVSMADLTMIDLLLRQAALASHPCHVLLVGDPDQLASVNVGAVLADIVDSGGVDEQHTRLATSHRFNADIGQLARAVNAGDVDAVAAVLDAGGPSIAHVAAITAGLIDDVVAWASALVGAASGGDLDGALALLHARAVLSATNRGPGSVAFWNDTIAQRLRNVGLLDDGGFGVGQPVVVTRNQLALGVANGDLGVVVDVEGERRVAFAADRLVALETLGFLAPAWALTIHKSQGSEYDDVTVCLPDAPHRLLSRQLLYTGITRARDHVTLVATPAALEAAVTTKVSRVSGLATRLSAAARDA
jgi:exodeoxyribonuclease V alpha subunit